MVQIGSKEINESNAISNVVSMTSKNAWRHQMQS